MGDFLRDVIFNFYFHFGLPGENGCNLTTILSDGLKPPSRKCSNENFESTKTPGREPNR